MIVQFPDGPKEWPSKKTLVPSREIPQQEPTISEEPVPHPDWRFSPFIGGWRATAR